jgi:hypothetical protein
LPAHAGVGTANAGTATPPRLPQQQLGTGVAAVAVAAAGGGGAAGGGASSKAGAAAGTDNPVRTLVAMWKVLTSYVQVRATPGVHDWLSWGAALHPTVCM